MSTTLTPKSPEIFPDVSLPSPGDDILGSSYTTTLTQLADRTDWLKRQFRGGAVSGTNSTNSTGSWVDVDSASISLGTCYGNDQVIVLGCGAVDDVSGNMQLRVALTDGTTTLTGTPPVVLTVPSTGTWTIKLQQYHASSGRYTRFSFGAIVRTPL